MTERHGYGGEVREDIVQLVGGVRGSRWWGGGTFQIPGASLDENYDNWTVVHRNIKRVQKVWGGGGQDAAKGRGGHKSVGDVIYGGGPGSATVRLRFLGSVGINVEDGVRGAHQFPRPNHGEGGTAEQRQDLGSTDGKGSVLRSGYSVGGHLY